MRVSYDRETGRAADSPADGNGTRDAAADLHTARRPREGAALHRRAPAAVRRQRAAALRAVAQ